jgi:hypothetical protein
MNGGGIGSIGPLAAGEIGSWNYFFDLRTYIAPPPSGKYKLRALYHNSVGIAGERDVSGLVVSTSKPIWVEVTNREAPVAKPAPFKFRPPLAIAAACIVLTLVSMMRPTQRSTCESANGGKGGPVTSLFPGLTRRDFCWGLLVVAISLGMWLDDPPNRPVQWGQQPDAAADWSMKLVDGLQR